METTKICALFFLILSIYTIDQALSAHHHMAAASSPAEADCSTLILNMEECLSFVSAGSTVTKPEGSCCSGLKTVLKTDPNCLCEAFKSSASLGVTLNVTKAFTLPAVCKVSAPSSAKCASTTPPAGAPGSSIAMAPTMSVGANDIAPAPVPRSMQSASSVLSVSVASLSIAIVAPFFFSF